LTVTYNILDAVSYTLIKIEFLQKLSTLTNEEKGILQGIKLVTRIENLKKRLAAVKIILHGLGGISGIAKDE
jgi:hypothetical protein